jgi:peptidoglycan/xylan/chitin deacetylase (PgdA/CDA1 family)
MWTVLSADFDVAKSGDQCYEYVRKHTKEGSIVVFHDSEKAWPRLQNALPKVLEYFAARGFQFKAIE